MDVKVDSSGFLPCHMMLGSHGKPSWAAVESLDPKMSTDLIYCTLPCCVVRYHLSVALCLLYPCLILTANPKCFSDVSCEHM